MLSIMSSLILLLFLGCLPPNIHQFCPSVNASSYDSQLLDCTPTNTIKTDQHSLPCTIAQNPSNVVKNSSQVREEISRPREVNNIISINFNNLIRRQVHHETTDDNCTSQQKISEGVVCAPNNASVTKESAKQKSIDVHIIPSERDPPDSLASNLGPNVYKVSVGSTKIIRCRFNVSNPPNLVDLSFKLRWLRLAASPQGQLKNQSIVSDENYQVTISTNRIWTLQRDGGLDLVLNDFESSDSGDYFCQAISDTDSTILDEQRVRVVVREAGQADLKSTPNFVDFDDAAALYSAENLNNLLPSLRIFPEYSELAYGERSQLACVTSDLDPDPDPDKLEWHFEPFKRPGYDSSIHVGGHQQEGVSTFGLPTNTSRIGNILMVWFMSQETVGIYKCSHHLEDFNLTAEASAEIAMRPVADSAPLVYITPELLRLSANGSAKIQCESTGYPVPSIEWYRVEPPLDMAPTVPKLDDSTAQNGSMSTNQSSGVEQLEGLQVLRLESRDVMAYCLQSGCRALDNLDSLSRRQKSSDEYIRSQHKALVTGLSWIQINGARAFHQGQYVCKATNKHGTNQASSIIDVEFKELPTVEIDEEHKQQTIVLDPTTGLDSSSPVDQTVQQMQNVTFRCAIRSGQPKPQLKWLRKSGASDTLGDLYKSANTLDGHDLSLGNFTRDDLDIYDLTRVSSATSKVATRYENNGKTLVLQLSTVSVDDEGDYICLGENELGRHSAAAQLVVRKPPQVRILQTSPKVFRPNESFQLDCLVLGHPSPIDIEWSRSDRGAYFSPISRHSPSLSAHQERAVLKFDRTTTDEAGEYTCAARDPLNEINILRDTIMLLAEEDQPGSKSLFDDAASGGGGGGRSSARHVPKLLVRPTKITAEVGSNITLDCLAVSGLQPTVVEWIAPTSAQISQTTSSSNHVRPYYRSQLIELTHGAHSLPDALLQFGSKLRLFNVSRAHEGVYQCKGRNKAGIENAPALVTVVDRVALQEDEFKLDQASSHTAQGNATQTKTKIARTGTNIELRCQVHGVDEQPATSWSREGHQLPQSSVQIDHNLWIQNLTKADEGLYLCSVRSSEPNEIIQAKIKLLVREIVRSDHKIGTGKYDSADLSATVVASKKNLNVGDSVTLECIINLVGNSSSKYPTRVLDDLERQVVWTNLHSGHSLFQDNVYIQNNLLIIYDLKLENTATYRCNYNDLSQYTDYKLQISLAELDQGGNATLSSGFPVSDRNQFGTITNNYGPLHFNTTQHVEHIRTSIGARLVLECPKLSSDTTDRYFWTRGRGSMQAINSSVGTLASPALRVRIGREMEPLVLNPMETSHAGLYQCSRQLTTGTTQYRVEMQFLVEVQVVSAKFVQHPVSFVTLPAVSDADHQLELELKFFPEHEHGLVLFSGAVSANTLSSGLMVDNNNNNNNNNNNSNNSSANSNSQNNKSLSTLTSADYISLGLVRGHLEFRYELGDGVTLLRSQQPLKLNQWHRLLIERNRRGATMWLDGQPPQSNSSRGKFFNLNLDSLLYVGGHQIFLTLASADHQRQRNWTARTFYGFAHGYQGCISHLRINGRELNLMSRNRSVAMGIFECDKPECQQGKNLNDLSEYQMIDCSDQNGLCQVDRSLVINTQPEMAVTNSTIKKLRSHPNADLRCLCAPGFTGPTCKEYIPPYEIDIVESTVSKPQPPAYQEKTPLTMTTTTTPPTSVKSQSACDQYPDAKCNVTGTGQCQSLSSTIFRCHCKIGFMGELCDQMATYTSETSAGFNQPAHVQLSFNSPQEVGRLVAASAPQNTSGLFGPTISGTLNETDYARLTTFTESHNITFKVQTRSSYGLLFYTGQISSFPINRDGSYKVDLMGTNYPQTSKSVVANLLARLSPTKKVGDFLAIALVDGHIELSYELGSGLAILRSSRRINDGEWHKIVVLRSGKLSKLTIDDLYKHEAHSPGKLSMLNVDSNIYVGGLPTRLQAAISSSTSSGSLLSTFMGCLSSLEINSLGPINLIRDDHLTRVVSASNLVTCNNGLLSPPASTTTSQPPSHQVPSDKISIDQGSIAPPTTEAPTTSLRKSSRRPTKPSHKAENDDDEADELARRSS